MADLPPMQKVLSSHVWERGYDHETQQLYVRFHPSVKHPGGRLVTYQGVPSNVGDAFMTAPSAGTALNDSIKGRYDFSG